MDVDVLMVLELFKQSLSVLEGLLEGVRIRPSEIGCISVWIEVAECVSKLDLEVTVGWTPG